jgi:HK97 family phage prohead protease
VFNSPTQINSWEGRFTEIIEQGAFARTVRANPKPVLQFDHGTHPTIGSMPIGSIEELREDDKGLYVRADLHTGEFFQPVRESIASGALDGMSFKFTIPEGGMAVDNVDGEEVRTLTDLNLHELGPVVWPAYKETSVAVRNLTDLLAEDEKLRHDVFAELIFGESADVRSDDSEAEPTDETTDAESVQESVRSDTDDEPTFRKTTRRDKTLAAIVSDKTDRALRHFENKEKTAWS